jgi:hypothetical protein
MSNPQSQDRNAEQQPFRGGKTVTIRYLAIRRENTNGFGAKRVVRGARRTSQWQCIVGFQPHLGPKSKLLAEAAEEEKRRSQ